MVYYSVLRATMLAGSMLIDCKREITPRTTLQGNPEQAARDQPYHAHLRLHHKNQSALDEDELSYKDLVDFVEDRLDEPIEDGILCMHICPSLPFNAVFRGYD